MQPLALFSVETHLAATDLPILVIHSYNLVGRNKICCIPDVFEDLRIICEHQYICEWTISGISFTNIMNRIGPSTLDWGIPLSTDKSVDLQVAVVH